MARISLPRMFYWDHLERDLPTPEMVQSNRAHILVDDADPALKDLLEDAEYYASDAMDQLPPGLKASAKATVTAIRKVTGL
ncbi:hypothetical protein ACC806_34755 [Rhizobium ruizarguesonis]